MSASLLLVKSKGSREKVILGTVTKSPVHKFEVGLSSSFTVEENYCSHLAKKPYKGRGCKTLGDLNSLCIFFCLKQDKKPEILAASLFM